METQSQIGDPIFENLNEKFQELEEVVLDIERDANGNMWFAGDLALQRFDGFRIYQYNIRNYFGTINDGGGARLFKDIEGNLWVSCYGLLLLYDPIYDDFHYLKFDLPDLGSNSLHIITAIGEDRQGNLWMAFENGDYPFIRISKERLIETIELKTDQENAILIRKDLFDYFPSKLADNDNQLSPDELVTNQILTDKYGDTWFTRNGWIERYTENSDHKKGEFIRYLEIQDYEGNNIYTYNPLHNNDVILIRTFLDKHNELWACTGNYLYRFTEAKNNSVPYDTIIHFPVFQEIYTPVFRQILYSANSEDQHSLYQDRKIDIHNLGVSKNYIGEVCFHNRNLIWLFQDNGKYIDVFSIGEDKNNNKTINKTKEINNLYDDKWSWKHRLLSTYLDEEGILWANDRKRIQGNGIVKLNTNVYWNFRVLSHNPDDPSSMPSNHMYVIHQDYKKNLWFFPKRHGINNVYLSDSSLNSFEEIPLPQSKFMGDFLRGAWEDHKNRIWLIGGLNVHVIDLPKFYSGKDASQWHFKFSSNNYDIKIQYGKEGIYVPDIILDKTNTLWAYTIIGRKDGWKAGGWGLHYLDIKKLDELQVNQFKNLKFQKYANFKDPGDTAYFKFYPHLNYWRYYQPAFIHDNHNYVYLLTHTALIRIDPRTRDYEYYKTDSKDTDMPFLDLWGYSTVLDDYEKNSIIVYGSSYNNSQQIYNVKKAVFNVSPGNLSLNSIETLDRSSGFPKAPSFPIIDHNRNLWLLGDREGLFRYDINKNEIQKYANPYVNNLTVWGFGRYQDQSGRIFLQGDDGIVVFHPDSLKDNPYISKIHISDIKIHGRSLFMEKDSTLINNILTKNTIILPYRENVLSLDFNSMSLANPINNKYKYMLSGWDKEWINTDGYNRNATYTKLSPGNYTFTVLGSNNDGVWNEEGASLNIVILPPWWLTWWAKGIYVLLFISAVWGFIYMRIRKHKIKLREMQQINDAFSKFVPYEFLHAIGREYIMDVKLGDKSYRDVTVLFLDIRNYTTLAESMTPDDNFAFIQKFVGIMGPIIIDNQGFVNQYLGDGLMAIFPEKVDDALKAAIDIQNELTTYNKSRINSGKEKIQMGVGLHTGPLIMGIIGDEKRSDPATIADTVNTASRLEGMTKYYGVKILVSEESLNLLESIQKYHTRYLGEVLVKGKNIPVKVYECFDGDPDKIRKKKQESIELFKEGLELYYNKEFPDASMVFKRIMKANPEDKAAAYYYNKAVTYALKGVPEEWNGIEKMEIK